MIKFIKANLKKSYEHCQYRMAAHEFITDYHFTENLIKYDIKKLKHRILDLINFLSQTSI